MGHPKDGLFRAFERQHSEGPDNPGKPFVRMLTSHVPVSAEFPAGLGDAKRQ